MKLAFFALFAITSACSNTHAAPPNGHIEGEVVFVGTPPKRHALDLSVDPVCAKHRQLSQSVIVNKGKLQDVHVQIQAKSLGKQTPPRKPVKINQTQCRYSPRVVGILRGQTLAIYNGDPTYHNVHGRYGSKTKFNIGHPASAPPILHKVDRKPGEIMRLGCDVHPWMQAFAVVSEHSFFDVTKSNGKFRIRGLAPGKYSLVAWHPKLGKQTAQVSVSAGNTTNTTIEFRP